MKLTIDPDVIDAALGFYTLALFAILAGGTRVLFVVLVMVLV